jgi:predicted aldo/keto reductase-like oxidoreductase
MVIMEPLRGGTLIAAANTNPVVAAVLASDPHQRSLAHLCFDFLREMPEATTILSGTTTLEQLQDNLRIFSTPLPSAPPSAPDLAPATCTTALAPATRTTAPAPGSAPVTGPPLYQQLRQALLAGSACGCTGCRYCLPCPQRIDIPQILRLYDNHRASNGADPIDRVYYQKSLLGNGIGAALCTRCGQCAEKCPQSLPIPTLLAEAHATLKLPPPPDADIC